AQRLQEHGATPVQVTRAPADASVTGPETLWSLDPAQPDQMEQLLQAALPAHGRTWQGIVFLWGLDIPPNDMLDADQLQQSQALLCGAVLHLVQALGTSTLTNSSLTNS